MCVCVCCAKSSLTKANEAVKAVASRCMGVWMFGLELDIEWDFRVDVLLNTRILKAVQKPQIFARRRVSHTSLVEIESVARRKLDYFRRRRLRV